jgi:hypothetical protein
MKEQRVFKYQGKRIYVIQETKRIRGADGEQYTEIRTPNLIPFGDNGFVPFAVLEKDGEEITRKK